MKSILIADDMAVFREPIAAALRLEGYESLVASDGEEALAITRQKHPDAILLDIAMPKMNAITFLKHLRADPAIAKTHVILLTAMSDRKFILAAASLGVKDYLLKSSFQMKEMLARIEKATAAAASAPSAQQPGPSGQPGAEHAGAIAEADIPKLLTRETFLARIQDVLQVKTLPGVVAQVIALTTSSRGDIQQLAGLISRDAMLSARVLQVANSAAYACVGSTVTTIADAIRKIGFGKVRNIAAVIGVFECMPEASSDGFNPIRYWLHSFAAAQLCERFASAKMADRSGLAYIIGLCHDLGEIFFHSYFAKEYQQVIDFAHKSGQPLDVVYRHMLGVTEAQMSAAVMKCLGIPSAIREPIEAFHSAKNDNVVEPLGRILWMAENYANAAMLASSQNSVVAPVPQAFCREVVGEANPKRPDAEALRADVLSLTVSLAKLSRADEAKLMAPLFNPKSVKIWLARHHSLSQFDPIETILQSMAQVQTMDRVPADSELAQIDGVIVAVPSADTVGFLSDATDGATQAAAAVKRPPPCLKVAFEVAETSDKVNSDWHTGLALSHLGIFVEKLGKAGVSQKAA